MALKVNFKVSGAGASVFSLDLEPSLTVEEVKCVAMEPSGLEPTSMKIIFKGRILKDADTLENLQVASGSTMHIVKSGPSASSATPADTPAATPASATAAAAPAPAEAPTAAAAMPDLGGMMADPAMMQAAMQMMGGMGGAAPGAGSPMGGMEGMMRDPQFMMQMMQNPMVQQMMQSISQNPQMLQAMIQNNPMIQQMTQNNPMLQQVLSNPQLLQSMFNPQAMQGMLQMQQAMAGMGSPGVAQTPALPGPPAAAPDTSGAAPNVNPMQQMMQMMQGMQAMSGMPGFPNPADSRPMEERFATQAQQLESMGFPDKHSNLQALSQTNGDVNEAITALLGGA
mmetsp:Transcript_11746/g.21105  ORF Transcript_11746/g.21105 Transcript_11746/m.21105 type:complete len:340 (+) Transcript_11746:72-1091(+)